MSIENAQKNITKAESTRLELTTRLAQIEHELAEASLERAAILIPEKHLKAELLTHNERLLAQARAELAQAQQAERLAQIAQAQKAYTQAEKSAFSLIEKLRLELDALTEKERALISLGAPRPNGLVPIVKQALSQAFEANKQTEALLKQARTGIKPYESAN